jgi:hypothetical protein
MDAVQKNALKNNANMPPDSIVYLECVTYLTLNYEHSSLQNQLLDILVRIFLFSTMIVPPKKSDGHTTLKNITRNFIPVSAMPTGGGNIC